MFGLPAFFFFNFYLILSVPLVSYAIVEKIAKGGVKVK